MGINYRIISVRGNEKNILKTMIMVLKEKVTFNDGEWLHYSFGGKFVSNEWLVIDGITYYKN